MTDLITRDEIANIAGVSSGTVYKVSKILEKITANLKYKLESGDLTIDAAYKQIQNENISKNQKITLEKIPLPKDLLLKVQKIFSNSQYQSIEIFLDKKTNYWKTYGYSKEIQENTIKQKLLLFIEKYNLGGKVEAVIWKIDNNNIECRFVTNDKTMLGKIKMNDIKTDIKSDIGIINTSDLKREIKSLNNNFDMSLENDFLKLSDGSGILEHYLANMQIIPKVPPMKYIPQFQLYFDLDFSFIEDFIKSKNALKETEFSIVHEKDKKYLFVFGNTNQIEFPFEAEKVINKIRKPIFFDADLFSKILLANKYANKIKLIISKEGLSHIKVLDDDIEVEYYLVESK